MKLFGVPPLGGILKAVHICFRLKAGLQTLSRVVLFAEYYMSDLREKVFLQHKQVDIFNDICL